VLAMVFSFQGGTADLRTPAILVVNALVGVLCARLFAYIWGTLTKSCVYACWMYGLAAAAAFRLVPPIMNEQTLYLANAYTADLPYVMLGAAMHGALAMLCVFPYARRVVLLKRTPVPGVDVETEDRILREEALQMSGGSMFAFLLVAFVLRLSVALLWSHQWFHQWFTTIPQ
jgi:H+/gluconate symporter-like permease